MAVTLVIRHAFVRVCEDSGLQGIHTESTDGEILTQTFQQSAISRVFPMNPPRLWIVFSREGGDRARLWSDAENRGEISNDGTLRTFDSANTCRPSDPANRLVIGWKSPLTWWLSGTNTTRYPAIEIADAQPAPFPDFGRLMPEYAQLQAIVREHRSWSWRTALSSVIGVYLITDTSDGRLYVGKADGAENISQRRGFSASNGHGGNVERAERLEKRTARAMTC